MKEMHEDPFLLERVIINEGNARRPFLPERGIINEENARIPLLPEHIIINRGMQEDPFYQRTFK